MGMQIGANWRIRWIAAAMGEMYKAAEPMKMQLAADSCGLKEQCIELGGCTFAPPGKYDGFIFAVAVM